jgi:hypothetical protein
MSAGAIIAIVVGVVVVIVLLALLSRAARGRRLEGGREQAAELRSDAADRAVIAKRERALADEQAALGSQAEAEAEQKAAVARRHAADAQQQAQVAEHEERSVQEKHAEAREVDPDVPTTPARRQTRNAATRRAPAACALRDRSSRTVRRTRGARRPRPSSSTPMACRLHSAETRLLLKRRHGAERGSLPSLSVAFKAALLKERLE